MRGRVLSGRYELVDKLGAGGMGEVWRARDLDLGREVAVKIFSPPEDVQDEERTELLGRFRREARAVAVLDSPHIATIHDHGADDNDVPYLVMELVEGRSLEQVLRDEGRVPVEEALGWAAQICRALGTAHAAGVVHRDVKPANVMVRPDGTAVVLDFGIAKFQEAVEAESKLTRTGHMPLGSVLYMAPERFRMEAGDGREDLYAVGCVLYELLIGRPPFVGPAAGVMYNHLNDAPLRPSRARAELGAHTDQLILDLMAKSADDRPADAGAARTRITEVREQLRPEPTPEPEPEATPEPEPESGPEPESAPAAPPPPPVAPVHSPSVRKLLVIGLGVLAVVATGVSVAVDEGRPADPVRREGAAGFDPSERPTTADTEVPGDEGGDPPAPVGEPGRYTVLYASPSARDDESAAPVRKALKEAGKSLELDVHVAAVESDAAESGDTMTLYPDTVAVIGDTSRDYGFSSTDGPPPVTVDTCGSPGKSLDQSDPSAAYAFGLRPSPSRVAAQLGTYVRKEHGARAPLVGDDGSNDELVRKLRTATAPGGGRAPVLKEGNSLVDERKSLVQEVAKRDADAVLLPRIAASGEFAPEELMEQGFEGPVLAPSRDVHSCDPDLAQGLADADADAQYKGVRRYRSGPSGAKTARSREHDAALAVATALARQKGTPSVEKVRESLAMDLRRTKVRGDLGPLAFDKAGYAKDRPLWIDRADGEHWREERRLSSP